MAIRKAHFIGIGGVGMSATAKLLRDSGAEVSGSDEAVYPPISTYLEHEGFTVSTPYNASNIPADVDAIIIGKNAKLVPETNEEVAAAMASDVQIYSFPEILAQLSNDKETVVVAGSYGKSTSTSILSHCLETAGLAPSYFIGAIPLSPASSATMSAGNLFILEGDEYPSSNTDHRSKFLHYHPAHILLTPLAHDHFNVFPTPEDYLKPFYELLTLLPEHATIVASVSGPLSKEFLANIKRPLVTYGVREGEFQAANIVWGEKTSFDITRNGNTVVRVEMTQLGEHNIENIVGVAAFIFTRNLMSVEQFATGIATFRGIKRRLDRKSERTTIPIFEGFGSSYDKLKSAIAAMKQHFPTKRLLVVFEPNTFSWRNRASLLQYDDVFRGAAKAYIFSPPHDGKETQLSTEEIAAHVSASGVAAAALAEPEQTLALLESELEANDCILLSTSGAMGGLVESIPALAEKRFPA